MAASVQFSPLWASASHPVLVKCAFFLHSKLTRAGTVFLPRLQSGLCPIVGLDTEWSLHKNHKAKVCSHISASPRCRQCLSAEHIWSRALLYSECVRFSFYP